MKKHGNKVWIAGVAAAAAALGVLALAVFLFSQMIEPSSPSTSSFQVMYVPFTKRYTPHGYIFVDQEDDSFFRLDRFPEDLRDLDGNLITHRDLKRGNLLEITFQATDAGSYVGDFTIPPVYSGAVQAKIVEEGSPGDTDRYEKIVNQLRDPYPEQPPSLNISYQEFFLESAVYCGAHVDPESYEWSYEDLNGSSQVVTGEKPPILQREDLTKIEMKEASPMELLVTDDPVEVQVTRWKTDLLGTEDPPEGETVELTENDRGDPVVEDAEPGWVYQVVAIWDESRAEYGFIT